MQQKTGLRALLLEKMLMILTKTVQKTEARLFALLSASNIDQTEGSMASTKLEVGVSICLHSFFIVFEVLSDRTQ